MNSNYSYPHARNNQPSHTSHPYDLDDSYSTSSEESNQESHRSEIQSSHQKYSHNGILNLSQRNIKV